MIAIDTVKRTSILVKRYGLYVFVPLFLIIAYSYTSSTLQQYRVTAKIELKDISAAQASSDIHSEYLVKQVLDELPFQADYYDSRSPQDELYGSELPVRLVFDGPRKIDANDTWLNLEVSGTRYYTLTDQDTTAYYSFNEPVHASFGNFKVTHRPVNQDITTSYMVRLNDPSRQIDDYYKNLRIEPGDDGRTLSLSILSGNPRKGAAFLNKLMQLYGGKTADRHGDLVTSKFTLIEKPEDNFESATLSPLWFYFLAFVAGLAIPLGLPLLRKRRRGAPLQWVLSLPKLVDEVQHRLAIKQVD